MVSFSVAATRGHGVTDVTDLLSAKYLLVVQVTVALPGAVQSPECVLPRENDLNPGQLSGPVSVDPQELRAWGLRSIFPYSMLGRTVSTVYLLTPVTLSRASTLPTL